MNFILQCSKLSRKLAIFFFLVGALVCPPIACALCICTPCTCLETPLRGGGGNGRGGLVQVHEEGGKGYWGGEGIVCW